MEDEFRQYAWEADYNDLPLHLDRPATPLLRTLVERREATISTGSPRWENRGRFQDGTLSTWLSEGQVLQSFLPLQLDVFHALWNLYRPGSPPKLSPQNVVGDSPVPKPCNSTLSVPASIRCSVLKSYHGRCSTTMHPTGG